MLRLLGILLAAAMILLGGNRAAAQAAGPTGAALAGSSGGSDRSPGQPAAPAALPTDTRTEKQKALSDQTQRLFDMATELKAEVNKTNKNILSLKVVEKAEEIEAMAKGIRAQAKR